MVCSIGSGQMAAMARLLAAVSFSPIVAEKVGSQNLAALHIQRDLHEVDEANWLDEEDMHVFDLMPMTDPLHLVCCVACNKPIKISQYAVHAELCKSLRMPEEMVSDLNGGTGQKKPPRKERKKLTAAYASTPSGDQERFESLETDSKNGSPTIDGAGVNSGNSDPSVDAIPPRIKRSKLCPLLVHAPYETGQTAEIVQPRPCLFGFSEGKAFYDQITDLLFICFKRKSRRIPAEAVHKSDHLRTGSDVFNSSCLKTQEAHICRELLEGSCGRSNDYIGYSNVSQVHGFGLQNKDISAPLATKTFYSLKNHRLRSALKYMYYESFSEENSDNVSLNTSQGDEMELQVLSAKNSFEEHKLPRKKGEKQTLPSVTSVEKPGQFLADCNNVCTGKFGLFPAMNFSDQDPVR